MVFPWNNEIPSSLKIASAIGYVIGALSLLLSVWSGIAILLSRKLRKPLWIFRLSVCVKDVVLCLLFLLPKFTKSTVENQYEVQGAFDLYLPGLVIACILSSIFTLLCSSIDRYHAATRPFRYHIGDLMPVGVALTLLLNCWTIAAIAAIAVVTDYTQFHRISYGALLQYVSIERWQKGLMLSGLAVVYVLSGYLLAKSLSRVAQQKRESRLRLESGQEEPMRSRKNSASEDQHRDNPTTPRQIGSDSEAEANEMFLQIEEPTVEMRKTKRKWSLTLTQKVGFFTPTNYRPSILRRVRDTWYLYAVVITWIVTLFTTVLPFFYVIISEETCDGAPILESENITNTTALYSKGDITRSPLTGYRHCVIISICDCMILIHGFLCTIIHIFIDDVFRPVFLRPVAMLLSPFRCCRRRGGSESTTYSAGRRRTLSRNSNIMSHSL